MNKNSRYKNIMYVQQLEYLPHKIEDIGKIVTDRLQPDKWAYIVHDFDEYRESDEAVKNGRAKVGDKKAPHLHLFMHWEDAPYFNSIVKKFGDKPQYFNRWNAQFENGFAYLIHETKRAKEESKYIYSADAVVSNFDYQELLDNYKNRAFFNIEPYILAYENVEEENKKESFKNLKKVVFEKREFLTVNQKILLVGKGVIRQYEISDYFTPIEYVKNANRINKAFEYYYNAFLRDTRRNISIFVLQGDSRLGKTSFATEYCEKANLTHSKSGSSENLWESYHGEDCFIIDDLRDSVFKPFELLKMIDPYYGTTNRARYFDRVFLGDVIFITTNKDIETWYSGIDEETRVALFSRIDVIYHFQKSEKEGYSNYYPIEYINGDFIHYKKVLYEYKLPEEDDENWENERDKRLPEYIFKHKYANSNSDFSLFRNEYGIRAEGVYQDIDKKNRLLIGVRPMSIEKYGVTHFYDEKDGKYKPKEAPKEEKETVTQDNEIELEDDVF